MTTGAGLTLLRNARRVAEVWLDEAESLVGGGARFRHLGDLEARRALRRKLHCRPFRWYLENIFPDHDPLPSGFRWATPPPRESAAATGAAEPRGASGERGAGVGQTDGDERRRLGNGTQRPPTGYSHVAVL